MTYNIDVTFHMRTKCVLETPTSYIRRSFTGNVLVYNICFKELIWNSSNVKKTDGDVKGGGGRCYWRRYITQPFLTFTSLHFVTCAAIFPSNIVYLFDAISACIKRVLTSASKSGNTHMTLKSVCHTCVRWKVKSLLVSNLFVRAIRWASASW